LLDASTDLEGAMTNKSTLAITDHRTGKAYDIAITDGAIRATDLRLLKSGPEDVGLLAYDPPGSSFVNALHLTNQYRLFPLRLSQRERRGEAKHCE